MKEEINNRHEDVVEKEKVMCPEIVVRGTDDKPYYEIKYYDVTDKQWHLGYVSYNLEYVKQWKEECLEIVEGSVTNILVEKIKEKIKELSGIQYDCEHGGCEFRDCIHTGRAIEIVNQVAEEFATDTNVGSKDNCCEWVRDSDEFDVYDTKCKNRHVFFEGSPADNEYEFCPYCGKEIVEVKQ